MSERDRAFMRQALRLAERGWGQTAPNPMVGAVLVNAEAVVAEGWHERYGEAHAEINAIRVAGGAARGSRLYVTLEPCVHQGKTPPCVPAIIGAGISSVTIAALDATSAGGGADTLRAAGLTVVTGVEAVAARELNAPFHFQSDRPWVTLKLALSAEGAIAAPPTPEGSRPPVWLTGSEARFEVHRLRAGSDAIAVGVGTILADDPQLTVRYHAQPRVPPVRVIFDRHARTPLEARVVRTARQIPTVIITAPGEQPETVPLRAHGVDVIAAADLPDALRRLRDRGIRSLLVEGGAGIAGELLNGGSVDRLVLLQSPIALGTGSLDAFARVASREQLMSALELREERRLGADVVRVYAVAGHDV